MADRPISDAPHAQGEGATNVREHPAHGWLRQQTEGTMSESPTTPYDDQIDVITRAEP